MALLQRLILISLLAWLSACSTMTTITANEPGTQLNLRGTQLDLPVRHSLRGTSFGNYEFKAQAPGQQPFFGLLPLSFKGGHLALDVLFFAPGAFFNLRAAFPYYEIDVANQVVRFKKRDSDPWTEMRPKAAEVERARAYFGEQ